MIEEHGQSRLRGGEAAACQIAWETWAAYGTPAKDITARFEEFPKVGCDLDGASDPRCRGREIESANPCTSWQ